jgi:hypothetical protein
MYIKARVFCIHQHIQTQEKNRHKTRKCLREKDPIGLNFENLNFDRDEALIKIGCFFD